MLRRGGAHRRHSGEHRHHLREGLLPGHLHHVGGSALQDRRVRVDKRAELSLIHISEPTRPEPI
eukprot:9339357-Pyramimonas_sp.AAC.1